MALLRDVHPTIAEILEGKHDDILHAFDQATKARRKHATAASGIRQGARIRITPAGGDIAGREGVVRKVNKTTVGVSLACSDCGKINEDRSEAELEAMTQDEIRAAFDSCHTCYGAPIEYRVSPALIEVVPAAVTA